MSTATARRFSTAVKYTDRPGKAKYIAAKYAELFTRSVLDIGCDQKQLRSELGSGVAYTGVDMCDAADVRLDLERAELPFADQSFETVVAADVLEHVDNMHAVFDEMCRVAGKYVIASLPNPYRNFILELSRHGGALQKFKYYGLGPDRPLDRHKWFFGAEDAKNYFTQRAARQGFSILQIDAEVVGWPDSVRAMMPSLETTWNLAAGTIWCVAARNGVAGTGELSPGEL
jgi:SAM-dependent methyltransferase